MLDVRERQKEKVCQKLVEEQLDTSSKMNGRRSLRTDYAL